MISFSKNDKHCLLYNSGHAKEELSFYASILKKYKSPVFFDVGANIGFFSKYLHQYCGEIHAFEPVSIVFDSLKENTKNLDNITTNKIALSNNVSSCQILLCSAHNQGHTLDPRMIEKFEKLYDHKTESIETTTLEKYCHKKNIKHIDLLKIDCEGFEKNAIIGLGNYIKNVKNIVFENYFPEDLLEILNYCSDHNFKRLAINNQPMYLLSKN